MTQTIPPAPSRRKRRSSKDLTAQVVDAAAAEFGAHGYAGATTAAIARRAEVTETQLFRFFPSKQALFRAAIFDPLDASFAAFNARHLAPALEQPIAREEQVSRYIANLHDFIEAHWRPLMAIIVASAFGANGNGDLGGIDGLAAYFDHSAASMARRLGGDAPHDPQLLVRVSFAAVLGNIVFRNFLFPDRLASAGATRAAIEHFVLHGIGAEEAASVKPARPARRGAT